jgi:hypothetical protein
VALDNSAPQGSPERFVPDPPSLGAAGHGLSRWVGLGISLALFVAAATQIARLDFAQVGRLLPASPLFWMTFTAFYMTTPLAEWVIFRRLWTLPKSGIFALTRKRIANEILLGYIGDLYFYTWARKRAHVTGAPFGAVKDVAILSAVVGNVATLALVLAAWPLFSWMAVGLHAHSAAIPLAILAISSVAPIFLRKQIFSLPTGELRFVLSIQAARIAATTVLSSVLWHLILPQVALSWWVILSAFRLLLSRLPFFPNKDFIFAGLAVLLIGHDSEIANLMAMMAGLMLATHLILGLILVGGELVSGEHR